ncbi:MAG: phage holin family protein, partial [Anaerolineae bacterium]|nr:phage holin family protein [Anaerolineae bacterium]
YFANPYNFSRTLLLTIWDIILEIYQFRKARRNKVYPILDRKKRGGRYPILRAVTTTTIRELNVYTLIGDMFAGVPSAYATFVGYDEVAHHSGVESEDAFDVLRKMDQQLKRLESAAAHAPRPYHFVILSDHGQSGGAGHFQTALPSHPGGVCPETGDRKVPGGKQRGHARGLEACQRAAHRNDPVKQRRGEAPHETDAQEPDPGWARGPGPGGYRGA